MVHHWCDRIRCGVVFQKSALVWCGAREFALVVRQWVRKKKFCPVCVEVIRLVVGIMIEVIVSAKVVYLMSGNLDTLMLRETRDLAMLLPMLLPMHSSFNPAAYVAAYAFVIQSCCLCCCLCIRHFDLQAPAGSSILADVAGVIDPGISILADVARSMALADARYA